MPGFDAVGDVLSTIGNLWSTSQTNKAAKTAATHAIQWRVQDAKKAGISPIYALGASGATMGPTAVADFSGLAQAGQDLTAARVRAMDRNERRDAALAALKVTPEQRLANQLALKHADLENQLLASQIARLQHDQVGPSSPMVMGSMSPGGGSQRVRPRPAEPVINSPNNNAREAGVITDYGYAATDRGGLSVTLSDDMYQRVQDNLPQELQWAWRNQVMPAIGGHRPPDPREFPLPRGTDRWRWSALNQEFFPYNSRSGMFLIDGRWVEPVFH